MTEQIEQTPEEFTQIPPTPVLPEYTPVVRRPLSVTVIAVLFFVGAAFEISGLFTRSHGSELREIIGNIDSIVFALLQIAIGVGLLQMRPPARMGAIIAIILRFVTTIPFMVIDMNTQLADPSAKLVPVEFAYVFLGVFLVIYALYLATLIFFLCRPAVKAAFAGQ